MPPELDFRALRTQVEAITRVPDFSQLTRRARKVRRRDRLAVAGALVGTLAIFSPIAVTAVSGSAVNNPSMLGRPDLDSLVPQPATTDIDVPPPKLTQSLLAVGGALPDDVFTAVDACLTSSDQPTRPRCSLQVTLLSKTAPGATAAIVSGIVRANPTEQLQDVAIVPLTSRSVLLSATVDGGSRVNLRVTENGAAPVHTPTATLPLAADDRPVQLVEHGPVYGVRDSDGQLSKIAAQPGLNAPTVQMSVPSGRGWWVSGYDQTTGQESVAVSHDQGAHWTVRALGAAGIDVPTVATADGLTADAFIRSSTGIRHFRSTDAGETWTEELPQIILPGVLASDGALAGRDFGALARADHSVLIWVADTTPVYLNSADGRVFQAYQGPAGEVHAVDGGFVALGDKPQVSLDCVNWAPAILPAPIAPN
jgi:hypothetical protein